MPLVLILALLAVTFVFPAAAREPNKVEAICLDTMFSLERAIASRLKTIYPGYVVVETHSSPLGPMLVGEEFLRDCWVARSEGGRERVELILFFFRQDFAGGHWTRRVVTAHPVVKAGRLSLRLGIISENSKLTRDVLQWVTETL